jgi:hypothetical protein
MSQQNERGGRPQRSAPSEKLPDAQGNPRNSDIARPAQEGGRLPPSLAHYLPELEAAGIWKRSLAARLRVAQLRFHWAELSVAEERALADEVLQFKRMAWRLGRAIQHWEAS